MTIPELLNMAALALSDAREFIPAGTTADAHTRRALDEIRVELMRLSQSESLDNAEKLIQRGSRLCDEVDSFLASSHTATVPADELEYAASTSVVPMRVSETGSKDEPLSEVISATSISGGADYQGGMPRSVTMERLLADGTRYQANYVQTQGKPGTQELAEALLGRAKREITELDLLDIHSKPDQELLSYAYPLKLTNLYFDHAQAESLDKDDRARCHSDKDGECSWVNCPQLRDGEPAATGRHCPLDRRSDNDG